MNDSAANGKLKWRDVLCLGFRIVALARIAPFVVHLSRLVMGIAYANIKDSGSGSFGRFWVHPLHEICIAAVPVLGFVLAVLLLVFARTLARLVVEEDKDITSLADGLRAAASIIGVSVVLVGIPDLLRAIVTFTYVDASQARHPAHIVWDVNAAGTYEIILSSLIICTGVYFTWGANWLVDKVCGVRREPEAYDAE